MNDNAITLHDGRKLGFAEYGKPDGIPLLLFHGTPGSRIIGALENVPWTEKPGMRVITPERPGYGLSDPAPGRTIGDWANDIEELADQLDLDRYHVAGGSGGGPYALACAIHSPARVLSATLICSGAPPEVMPISKDMQRGNRIVFFLARYAPFLLKLLFAHQARAMTKYPERIAAKIRSGFPEPDRALMNDKKVKNMMLQMSEAFRQGGDGTYRDLLLVARRWHLDLDKIAVPVFMWHGEADTLVPFSAAEKFSTMIPGCEAHFLPGAGHQVLASEETASQMVGRMLSVSA